MITAESMTHTLTKNSEKRERRVIPSLRIIRTPSLTGFERRTFWGGDLTWYTTPWITITVDWRTDFQMMSDMILGIKRGKSQ